MTKLLKMFAGKPPRQQVWQATISNCSDSDLRKLLADAQDHFARDPRWRSHVITAHKSALDRRLDN
jgi:hypothetical protein